ncbi:acid protease [Mycena vulgaris]|nr:acid protease [Mycena vulgaris]
MVSSSLLHTVLLAWSSTPHHHVIRSEGSGFKLPISAKFNTTRPLKFGRTGAARASFLRAQALDGLQGLARRADIVSLIEDEGPFYVASVLVGSPGTTYNLIVDTGSANTWIGAAQPYNQTSTSNFTGKTVAVNYGQGRLFWSASIEYSPTGSKNFSGDCLSALNATPLSSKTGILFLDQISIPGVGVMPNTTIGVAQASNGFKGVDGVLGMGPDELSRGTVGPDPTEMLPAIVQTLFCQGNIPAEVFSIFMQPTGISVVLALKKSIGSTTSSLAGPPFFVPMTTHFPASAYWGVDMQFSYGSTSILRQTAGIIDTGSTLIYLAHGAYLLYESLTKARLDPSTGLLTVPSMSNLQNLIVKMGSPAHYLGCFQIMNAGLIGGRQFPLIPNAQIWPRMLNTAIRGQSNQIYLVVADLGTEEGAGLDFVLGMVFLQRYYSAYDYDNGLIGLSETAFTGAISN